MCIPAAGGSPKAVVDGCGGDSESQAGSDRVRDDRQRATAYHPAGPGDAGRRKAAGPASSPVAAGCVATRGTPGLPSACGPRQPGGHALLLRRG